MRHKNVTHGESNKNRTKEYTAWAKMKDRCYNPKKAHYDCYGGRGIRVCDEWINSYETFLNDMGRAPSKGHSMERIDVNGNYCKANCRWATQKEQMRNIRTNRFLTHDGETMIMADWAERLKVDKRNFHASLARGKTISDFINNRNLKSGCKTKKVIYNGILFNSMFEARIFSGLPQTTFYRNLRKHVQLQSEI